MKITWSGFVKRLKDQKHFKDFSAVTKCVFNTFLTILYFVDNLMRNKTLNIKYKWNSLEKVDISSKFKEAERKYWPEFFRYETHPWQHTCCVHLFIRFELKIFIFNKTNYARDTYICRSNKLIAIKFSTCFHLCIVELLIGIIQSLSIRSTSTSNSLPKLALSPFKWKSSELFALHTSWECVFFK